jgi:cytosine/adenosine deaminase-related metal-dependent hydrolase
VKGSGPIPECQQEERIVFREARCAIGPQESAHASLEIASDRISRILSGASFSSTSDAGCAEIDLSGFLVMPGLINAHDHLEFALFPRLADPPYRNYIDWGEDIHKNFSALIAKHRAVPKEVRVWWGGIRNLLSGVTTVSHHNPLRPELQKSDFPVKVVSKYGWAHSLELGGDLRAARAATPEGGPFIVHACEGVDELARKELWGLDQLGLLDANAVLVHGLAIDHIGVALMRARGSSLVVCPSSNQFLFEKLPDMSLFSKVKNVALGNDSPLTAEGDLLDEIRFAMRFCRISPQMAYRMVTTAPAAILRLHDTEGSIKESGVADLIAVRDTGHDAADRLQALSANDVELVMIGGRVQLASEALLEQLPLSARQNLEPLTIDGVTRWLRAPVKTLLEKAEEALGKGEVQLGSRAIRLPDCVGAAHAG